MSTPSFHQLMVSRDHTQLVQFLHEELAIPSTSIMQALQQCKQDSAPLPMVLWQQGVLTLQQLERIFDWMEVA